MNVLMPCFYGHNIGPVERDYVVRWLKQEGDRVEQGEALFEAETVKAIIEVPAPVSGRLAQIIVAAGGWAFAYETVGVIEQDG